MRLKDTGLTVQEIKDKVNKYMIEPMSRFDFLAETSKVCTSTMKMEYHIWIFYAGNCSEFCGQL